MKNAPVLSRNEEQLLALVLDEVIPPSDDGRFPGAGEVGVGAYIGEKMIESPELVPMLQQALSALDDAARTRGASFDALPPADRVEVLNEIGLTHPGFLPSLIFHSYSGYYLSPPVIEALGLEARPPHPKGYTLEAGDLDALLAPVRQRPKIYVEP